MKPIKLFTPATVLTLAALLATTAVHAAPSGSGGGHASTGGHSRASSSSHSSASASGGHSIGHAFARLFGRSSTPPSSAQKLLTPLATKTLPRTNTVQLLRPQLVFVPPRKFPGPPIRNFPFAHRFFPFLPGFGFAGCANFASASNPFFFNNGFDCFNSGFSFDPFFSGGFSSSYIASPSFLPYNTQWLNDSPADAAPPAQPSYANDFIESPDSLQNPSAADAAPPDLTPHEPPVTLLQLRDGSVYALVTYWLADGQLHYTATFGGQSSIPLNRIDFDKTVQLNAARGIHFALPPDTPQP
jgi:hypothetical protein